MRERICTCSPLFAVAAAPSLAPRPYFKTLLPRKREGREKGGEVCGLRGLEFQSGRWRESKEGWGNGKVSRGRGCWDWERERESVWVGEFKQPRERDWRKHSIRILRQLLTPWRVGVQLETVGFAKFASVKRLMERRHVDNVFALHSVCTRGGDDKAADSHAVAKLAKFLPTQTCSAKSRFG